MNENAAVSFFLHVVQWRVEPGGIEANLDRAGELMMDASPREGDVVVLPEMFSSGFHYAGLGKIADRAPEVKAWMADRAREHRVHVAGSFAERVKGGIVNRLAVFGPGGEEGIYDKVHLFTVTAEDRHFAAGNRMAQADLGGVRAGLLVCFDLRFPEAARTHALGGASLLLVPSQWPISRADHFRLLARARAMENQLFVAAANACGLDGSGKEMAGQSLIAGPHGEILAGMGTEEGFASAAFSTAAVSAARRDFPTLRCRRPEAYSLEE